MTLLARAALCGQVAVILTLGRIAHLAHETVQEGEGGGLAVVINVRVGILDVHQTLRVAERLHHLSSEIVELVVGEAHLVDEVVYRLYMQLARTLEAQTFILGLTAVHAGYKYYGYVFTAA